MGNPKTSENTVAIFTGKSLRKILDEGGSQAWRLTPARVRRCEWIVITQNAHNAEPYADGTEPHGSAFLVGRISGVVPATHPDADPGRWMVEFSEFARCSIPDVWQGDRYPVRYTNLDELGISLDGLEFEEYTPPTAAPFAAEPPAEPTPGPLTIAQAKAGLAENYGVDTDSIEIVIRG
ncbi:hypothetical protein [Nocardia grenadensis]|uniref:hypothetical protein n=1 Tax=Nocardia grenadensis TaxID=931537 RepID=UPI0007A4F79C|nr:hypothetical protein [Nocardia grenadensis]